ncbi:SAM-dependent methyltransferase [Streptacidiphilus sp. N1-3]|uniref:SAM-dependent methyltransferase n=1 Tax=Streptacidiphilus alkalitolerans TaxID=3342712 RepID=A0ABV6XAR1_9ACTN
MTGSPEERWTPPTVDWDSANPARMYDYFLGGKDNFPVDRQAADKVLAVYPSLRNTAVANRGFLLRGVRRMAEEGIAQFLDIGSGYPTSPNVHEVAQSVAPSARVVYVDNDPVVLVHARAKITSSPEGVTGYVLGDLRDPADILAAPPVQQVLDLNQPVGLILAAVLHFLPDDMHPLRAVQHLIEVVAPGSYVLMSHITADFAKDETFGRLAAAYSSTAIAGQARTRREFEQFFEGLELVAPGITLVQHWLPEAEVPPPPDDLMPCYGALARKP